MKSIRSYLLVVTLSVICLANFTAALQGYRDSLSAADRVLEQQLLEKLHTLLELVNAEAVLPEGLYDQHTLYQVWRGDRQVAGSAQSPPSLLVTAEGEFHEVSYQGRRWRAIGQSLPASDAVVIVATRMDAYARLTEDILLRAIIPIVWVLPILGLLVWIVVRAGMKPIARLAGTISHRAAHDFRQLPCASYPDELAPIVSALNNLFQRLEWAFEKEKRFSADAAHELRTPLAVFKVNLHNLATASGDSEELRSLGRAAERMEHCIEQLLTLHRVLNDADDSEWVRCDLYPLAQQVIAEVYEGVALKGQGIELQGSQAAVLADPVPLAIMLRNLIDNASKYAPEQGRVLVSVFSEGERSCILVEDSGPGIPPSEYSRVLDRFYRVGGDRHSSQVTGSGLGLSIVAFVVEVFRGELSFSSSSSLGGLAVKVCFPASGGSVGQ